MVASLKQYIAMGLHTDIAFVLRNSKYLMDTAHKARYVGVKNGAKNKNAIPRSTKLKPNPK